MCHVEFDKMVTISKNKRVRGIPNMKKPKMAMCKQSQITKIIVTTSSMIDERNLTIDFKGKNETSL